MYFDTYLVQSVMYFLFPLYKENIFRSTKHEEEKNSRVFTDTDIAYFLRRSCNRIGTTLKQLVY